MAHEWFIKRSDKIYGPFSSAQLKKLAAEGKVSPATEVRLGAEGSWTSASHVKGLFAGPPSGSSSASLSPSSVAAAPPIPPPPVAKPAASQPPVVAPHATGPLATMPPIAKPLTAMPLASAAAAPASVRSPIAGKLIGAIGLTFGVLALGTCWLSFVEPIFGWIGIAVGALGLLVGFAGLVVAALQNAAGLVLNVAAATSALVGLVVSVALGISTGMFSRAVPPAVTAPPIVVQSPPPPAPKVEPPHKDPEPAPPPEPVWTDAGQSIERGPIRASITAAAVEQVRLESANPLSMQREKAAPYLHVQVRLENISADKIVNVPGWMGAGGNSGALGMVGQALGDSPIGKQLAGATAAATLVDDKGNGYPQIEAIRLPSAHAELGASPSLRPGESSEKHLLFDRPIDTAQFLRIELAPTGFGGTEPLRFQISRAIWTGEKAVAPATGESSTAIVPSDP
jgi:hypothetical protein